MFVFDTRFIKKEDIYDWFFVSVEYDLFYFFMYFKDEYEIYSGFILEFISLN